MRYCTKCGAANDDDAQFCSKCGTGISLVSTERPALHGDLNLDKLDYEVSKQYLGKAKDLETEIYTLRGICNEYEKRIASLGHSQSFEHPKRKFLRFSVYLLVLIGLYIVGFLVVYPTIFQFNFLASVNSFGSTRKALHISSFYVANIFTLISMTIFIICSLLVTFFRYEKEMKCYNIAIQHDADRVQFENNVATQFRKEQKQVWQQIKESESILAKLYSYNILYPKYRQMVSVATIFEYLDSGRCFSLSGTEGAYNLYEDELRHNTIIGRLDQVINRLDRLQQTQSELCRELEDSDRVLSDVRDDMEYYHSSLGSARENASVTAYNSKVAASNSDILLFMEALR